MCFIKKITYICCILAINQFFGQDRFTAYFEPDVAVNYSVAQNYSHNFEVSQRAYLYQDEFGYRTRQLDIAHFSSFKIAFTQSIALGIQYRFRDNFEKDKENELRFTQQYNITRKKGSVRFWKPF